MLRSISKVALGVQLATLLVFVQAAGAQGTPSYSSGSTLASSYFARAGAAGVVHDGKLYALGGSQEDQQITPTSEALNFDTNSWEMLSPMPRAVTQAGVEVVDGMVWVVGGFEGNEPPAPVETVQIYTIAQDTWHFGPPLPAPRASGTLALLGRTLHYIGGLLSDGQTDVSEHYVLDVDDPEGGWTAAAPLPARRNHLSSAVVGGRLYAIGGQRGNGASKSFSQLVYVYDDVSSSWSRAADLPAGLSHTESSTSVYNGRILVAGGLTSGQSAEGPTDQILAYDPAVDAWSEIGKLPVAVHSFEAGMVGNQLIAAHGSHGLASAPQSTAFSVALGAIEPDTLGFWPTTLDMHLTTGNSARLEALLWTARDAHTFAIDTATLPSWITSSTSSGTVVPTGTKVGARIDASHLEPGTYRAVISATTPTHARADFEIVLTVTPKSTDLFLEGDGLVVIEAENFQSKQAGLLNDWTVSSRYSSEGASVAALPNRGLNWEMDLAPNGPRLGYRVRFAAQGTYYVWVRAWGANGNADSWHVGVDGAITATADRMTLLTRRSWPPLWDWSNSTMDGPRATLEIPSSGEHLVNIWMREDGTFIDRILLTTDPDYVPEENGPAESSRISAPAVETSVSDAIGDEHPATIVLEPNYPNPFNPTTLIRYSVPNSGYVRLAVSNLLGQEIALLVDSNVSAGDHEVRYEASGLPSGMYFYTLKTAGGIQTRSMLLAR